jgi:hypothetical protein
LCSVTLSENGAIYDVMWKKHGTAGQTTDENIIRSMGFAYGKLRLDIHSEYVILIVLQQEWRSWLRHCATSREVAGSIPDGVTGIFH